MSRTTHDSAHADNAMTEIALALAMGFFSIMVLTMVSMGAGQVAATTKATAIEQMKVVKSLPASATSNTTLTAESDLIVHFNGAFFDAALNPIDPATFIPNGAPVLALDPTLNVSEAIKVQSSFQFPNLTVTTLNENWLNRLREEKP